MLAVPRQEQSLACKARTDFALKCRPHQTCGESKRSTRGSGSRERTWMSTLSAHANFVKSLDTKQLAYSEVYQHVCTLCLLCTHVVSKYYIESLI